MSKNIKIKGELKTKFDKLFKEWELVLGKDIAEMLKVYILYRDFKTNGTSPKDFDTNLQDFLEFLEFG